MERGTRLGSYEILEPVGSGGMGEVYSARDTRLKRPVAIKLLPPELSRDSGALARFRREAELLASINHPNIATLHAVEEADERSFLVMELLEGETLAVRIKQEALAPQEVLRIGREVAAGLEAAHDRGVVHRDLKPSNVMLLTDGRVKVLDFGVALPAAGIDSPDRASAPTHFDLTEKGTLIGTPPYMSPEQVRGQTVDHRADIWAFGCLLYEMFVARSPFARSTAADTLSAILEHEPDWSALPADTPLAARRLLDRCLRKDPRRRLRDIGDAWAEIEDTLSGDRPASELLVGGVDPPVDATRRLPWLLAGGAALVAVLAVLSALGAFGPRTAEGPTAGPEEFSILIPDDLTLDVRRGAVALSPDSQQVVFVASDADGVSRLYRRPLAESRIEPLPGTEAAQSPFFSPDSRWVAYVRGGIQAVSLEGGSRELAPTADNTGGAWGETGTIAFRQGGGIWTVPEAGGEAAQMARDFDFGTNGSNVVTSFLPGGTEVLFARTEATTESLDEARISALDLATGTVTDLGVRGSAPRWVRGALLWVQGDSIQAVRLDPDTLETDGISHTVASGVMTNPAGVPQYAIADDGTLLFVPGEPDRQMARLLWIDRSGEVTEAIPDIRGFRNVSISPDGARIAAIVDQQRTDLWLWSIGDPRPTRLTREGVSWFPVWDTDSRLITQHASPEWRGLATVVNDLSSPGGRRQVIVPAAVLGQDPAFWSPMSAAAGKLALISRCCDPGSDLGVLAVGSGAEPQKITETQFNEQMPAFSPDGRWIAYSSDESGASEVYVRGYPASGPVRAVSSEGGWHPRWSRDGRALFYRQGTRIMRARRSAGETGFESPELWVTLEPTDEDGEHAWDVADDGRILIIRPTSPPDPPRELRVVRGWVERLDEAGFR